MEQEKIMEQAQRPLKAADRLIVALDVETLDDAQRVVTTLKGAGVTHFKVGLGLFTTAGAAAVELVHRAGGKVFLDLKFHDIPNTVAHACRSAARLGAWMTNLHLQGGSEMMRLALESVRAEAATSKREPPLLIGVTILTSMGDKEMAELGVARPLKEQVIHLAKLARQAGLNGVVASPQEAQRIRLECGPDFVIVTPGIRPAAGAKPDDQKRVATPADALKAGADYIVVGRPILEAKDPAQAAAQVVKELGG